MHSVVLSVMASSLLGAHRGRLITMEELEERGGGLISVLRRRFSCNILGMSFEQEQKSW